MLANRNAVTFEIIEFLARSRSSIWSTRRLNNLQGITGDEFDLNQAEAELQVAQSRLEQSESDYQMYLLGPDPDAVALADSRIATAEVRLAAAQDALLAAQSTLSDLDLVATIDKQGVTVSDVNAAMKTASENALAGILGYSEVPLVSTDYNGSALSSIFDADTTYVIGDMVKVLSWYDNESGYSNRMVDLAAMVGSML